MSFRNGVFVMEGGETGAPTPRVTSEGTEVREDDDSEDLDDDSDEAETTATSPQRQTATKKRKRKRKNNNRTYGCSPQDDARYPESLRPISHVWMRDPFVAVVRDPRAKSLGEDVYYMFGTTDEPPAAVSPYSTFPAKSFQCYSAPSLAGPWRGPREVFSRRGDASSSSSSLFWADTQFWAPEVHQYCGEWYLVASFRRREDDARRIQILRSASRTPQGPFVPYSEPVTPRDWFSLDGTLYFGEEIPYLVFCREWLQVGDGQICALPLSGASLSASSTSRPVVLFSASQAAWTRAIDAHGSRVTDGPFLWTSRATGELLMLWSSIGEGGRYQVGVSRSASGRVMGPWTHDDEPLMREADAGHAMLFRPRQDEGPSALWDGCGVPPIIMALHSPNVDARRSTPLLVRLHERVEEGKLRLSISEGRVG